MTICFSSLPMSLLADETTGFAAETDGNTWPWLKVGIGETPQSLISVLDRMSKAGLEIPNFLNQSRKKLYY